MPYYDIAILGSGIAPCLLGLLALADAPGIKLLLLTTDAEVGGVHLELVLLERLPRKVAVAIGGSLVGEWEGYYLRQGGKTSFFRESVGLIDPSQLWLELLQHVGEESIVSECGVVDYKDGRLFWHINQVNVGTFFNVSSLVSPLRQSNLVDAEFLSKLNYPVIGDFDAGGENFHYLQYIPLGSGVTLIHRVSGKKCERVLKSFSKEFDISKLETIAFLDNIISAGVSVLTDGAKDR